MIKFLKFNNLIATIKKSNFIKNVSILASGTIVAQAIPVLLSPILTRLYSPIEFGLFAVFTAIITSLSPVISGKYEVALMLPKKEDDALDLLSVCFYISFIFSLLFLGFCFFFKERVLLLFKGQDLGILLFLTPIGLFFTGIVIAMEYFANRNYNYSLITKSKLVKGLSISCFSIIFSFYEAGLIFGFLFGVILSALYLIFSNKNFFKDNFLSFNQSKWKLVKEYKDYPIYNGTTSLLNGITLSLPVFFLAFYFPDKEVGYFALVMRIAAPLSIISMAVSQVNLRKVVDMMSNEQKVFSYIIKVTFLLVGIILVPCFVLLLYSPVIFPLIFGEGWFEAGIYMQILIPAISVKFVAVSLSTTLGATRSNRVGAMWKSFSFITTFFIYNIFAPKGDIIALLKAAALADVFLYLIYYILILKVSMNPGENQPKSFS